MAGAKLEDRPPPDFVLEDPPQISGTPITSSQYQASSTLRDSNAIVIDLGSSSLRAGFSSMSEPALQLPPMVARMRDADTGIRTFLIGNEALVSSARSTARPAYEAGIPNNPALMERLLDGTLVNLGLAEEETINHKFVLTEAPCQPNSARALFMEILFEAYLTPGVCFGIDALFSYFYNRHAKSGNDKSIQYASEDALVVSCGFNSTHILPVVNRRLEPRNVKRLNVGGMHMTDQLTRRLQLLNSDHAGVLTPARVEVLKEKLCYVSSDYRNDLNRLKVETDFYNQVSKSVKVPTGDGAEKPPLSAEDQEKLRQARIENGRRLSEMMREKRKTRLAGKDKESGTEDAEDSSYTEEEVVSLNAALRKWYDLQRIEEIREIDEDNYYFALIANQFHGPEAFNKELEACAATLEAERGKLTEPKIRAAEEAWWKKVHEDELLSMSDSDLNPTELKRKRHVRALRGAAEARIRAKRAKELEKAEIDRKAAELKEMREERPQEYLERLMLERTELAGKIKKRKAAREAGSDRRSQAARERMRLLAQHAGSKASVEEVGKNRARGKRNAPFRGRGRAARGKARVKGGRAGKKAKADDEEEDNFGYNDSDWDVYRSMKVGGESDSEDNSGEERERLESIRTEIRELAPDEIDPTLSRPEGVALLYENNRHSDEIVLTVDRMRTGEILFQPTLAGVEQCGLVEAMRLSAGDRSSVVKEVFVTGGVAQTAGLHQRFCRDLRMCFPTEIGNDIERGVHVAQDPTLDAWRGAALFAEQGGQQFLDSCVTKQDWDEMGIGYLREHAFSNAFFPTPELSAAELERKKKMQKQASKRGRPRGLLV